MTTDEYLALTDRERDALVAEAMGMVPCGAWRMGPLAGQMMKDVGGCTHGACYPVGNVPHLTTKIAAAWLVVEVLDDWAFTLESDGAGRWDARFWMGDTFYDAFGMETPVLAICLAALRAVGAVEDAW